MATKVTGVESTLKQMRLDFKEDTKVGYEKTKKKLFNNIREATPVDTGRAKAGWVNDTNLISNQVEYVDDLNNGSSKREPLFFIEKAVLSTPGVVVVGQIVKTK